MSGTAVKDILRFMGELAPFSLAESWDNCGLMVGDLDAPVRKIMAALDVTRPVAEEAAQQGVDCIVSHHPLIFHPLKAVTADGLPYYLIRKGIAVISAHTNLDIAFGGVCDRLAALLGVTDTTVLDPTGKERYYKVVVFVPRAAARQVTEKMADAGAGALSNYTRCSFSHPGTGSFLPGDGAAPAVGAVGKQEQVDEIRVEMLCSEKNLGAVIAAMKKAHPYEEPAYDVFENLGAGRTYGIGRVGTLLSPMSGRELAERVRDTLGCPSVRLVEGSRREIKRVALANGAESGLLPAAIKAGADALVAGEVKHNVYIDAQNAGITLIDAGHFDTENLIVPVLETRLKERFPGVEVIPSTANRRPYESV